MHENKLNPRRMFMLLNNSKRVVFFGRGVMKITQSNTISQKDQTKQNARRSCLHVKSFSETIVLNSGGVRMTAGYSF